jgi:hypothetical protein
MATQTRKSAAKARNASGRSNVGGFTADTTTKVVKGQKRQSAVSQAQQVTHRKGGKVTSAGGGRSMQRTGKKVAGASKAVGSKSNTKRR